jgi:hypothetical protein
MPATKSSGTKGSQTTDQAYVSKSAGSWPITHSIVIVPDLGWCPGSIAQVFQVPECAEVSHVRGSLETWHVVGQYTKSCILGP